MRKENGYENGNGFSDRIGNGNEENGNNLVLMGGTGSKRKVKVGHTRLLSVGFRS